MSNRLRVYAAGALSFAFVVSQVGAPVVSALQSMVIPSALASHTQNQYIDPIQNTGAQSYSVATHFHTDVFRPWGDSGNYQQAGIVYPPEWVVEAIDSPNYTCVPGEKYGPGTIVCDPEGKLGPLTTENTGMPITVRFRVAGNCGTSKEISTTVANGFKEHPHDSVTWLGNSPWVKTTFSFPACGTGGGGTPAPSGNYTCDAAGLKQAVQDSKVRFDKVPDGNAFYTWNDTNCRFPVTKGTFNILNSTANQSLYHNAHDYIEPGSQKVLWMVRPTTGCIWVQNDLVAGHQTLGQQGMSLSSWESQVNFSTYGVSAYIWGGPCSAPASSAAASSVAASSAAPVQQPSLTIQKTAPGGTFTPGSTISYTVTVTNVGQGNATDVYIDDPYATISNLELVSHPNCSTWMSQGKPVLRCVLGNVNAGQSKSVTLSFRIPTSQACNASGQTGNEVVNSAGTTGKDLNGNWVQAVWTPHVRTAVTCAAASSSFSSVTWSTGPISSAASSAFSSVTWSTPAASSSIASSQSSPATQTQTTLGLDKTVQEQSTFPGQDLHYTVTVRNTGSIPAQNVYVDDYIHPNMFVSQMASQCSINAGAVRCLLGTLQPGQSVFKTLTYRTDTNYACGNGSVARNSAGASATNAQSVTTALIVTPVNCFAASSSTAISSAAPLEQCRDGIDNDGDGKIDAQDPGCHYDGNPNNPGSYTPGDNNEYNAVSSASSSMMSSSISSMPPAAQCRDNADNDNDGKIDSQDPGCHYDGNPNNPGSYTPEDNSEYDIASSSSSIYSSSSSYSSIATSTDLVIYKAGPTGVIRGNSISYSLAVTNNGSIAAPNVVLTDPIPDSLQYLPNLSDSTCAQQGSTIVCQAGTVNPGQTKYVTVTFMIPHVQACHQETVSNIAFVSSAVADSNPDNNHSQIVSTTVYCPNSSSSSSSSSISSMMSSSSISSMSSSSSMSSASSVYLQQCRDGMDNDTDARIDMNDPGCHYDNNPNNPASYIPYDDDERDVMSSSSSSYSSIYSSSSLSSSTSSSSSAPGYADLSIIKTGPAQNMQYTPVSYAVQVTNNGNAPAQNVIVTDPTPDNFAFQPQISDASCSLQGSNVICNVGTLNPGQTKTVILAFKQNYVNVWCQPFSVQNVAIANTSTQESSYSNNVSQPATTQMVCGTSSSSSSSTSSSSFSSSSIGCNCSSSSSVSSIPLQSADLSIQKSGPATVYRGGAISYQITVRNNGPLTSENVRITDPIPDSLQYVANQSDAGCYQQGSTIMCNAGTLGMNQQKTLTLTFLVPSQGSCAQSFQNTASVAASTLDTNPGNNYSNTVVTNVMCVNYPSGNKNASVDNNANTNVNNTINAGSSNTTIINQNGGTNGVQNSNVENGASTSVNNTINAGSQNQTAIVQQANAAGVQNAGVDNTANTAVNNTVNAGSQNQTGINQQGISGTAQAQQAAVENDAQTKVNNTVNAASENRTGILQWMNSFWSPTPTASTQQAAPASLPAAQQLNAQTAAMPVHSDAPMVAGVQTSDTGGSFWSFFQSITSSLNNLFARLF
jgi:uncharacterized repeat protein (TIGR01451 family)